MLFVIFYDLSAYRLSEARGKKQESVLKGFAFYRRKRFLQRIASKESLIKYVSVVFHNFFGGVNSYIFQNVETNALL